MKHKYIKYPRTYHLPWSLGVTSDDKVLKDLSNFEGKLVVVTEKLDGENTTIYNNYFHARSLDGNKHPSQDMLKNNISLWQYMLPTGVRVCGENVYAKHSIEYSMLDSYFQAFSVWEEDICLDWYSTVDFLNSLGVTTVPVLYIGTFDEHVIKSLYTGVSSQGGVQEGYVVRLLDSFKYEDFSKSVAKFVRKNHVQTDKNWRFSVIKRNGLK